jgi:uncharacterized protein YndB with AHSA1/START domain
MSLTEAPREAIVIDVALDAPPDRVWRALTEPEWVARWLGEADIAGVSGQRFSLKSSGAVGEGPVECEVIDAEPDRRLSYRWRAEASGGMAALDTVVTWVLEPTPDGGTRLRLVHDGFPITLTQAPAVLAPTVKAQTNKAVRAANDNGRILAWAA